MINWLALVSLLVQLALAVVKYLERKQSIEEGRALALKDLLEEANELATNAEAARDSVDPDPAAELRDPNNEDNATGVANKSVDPANGV